MRFWIDTEFDDSRPAVDLIALAAVSEDNREYYAVSTDFDPARVKPWVKENVIPKLGSNNSDLWKSLSVMREEFLGFVGTEPAEFWSLNPTYDWYLITWNFFHGWDNLPSNWPFECYDLAQWAFHLGVKLPKMDDPEEHHALADAHYHRQLYEFLVTAQDKK